MIHTKSMAVAAAALAMCMAGSAFAQDSRFDRGDRFSPQQQQQQRHEGAAGPERGRPDGRADQRGDYRGDYRSDYRGDHRSDHRADYRPGYRPDYRPGRQFDHRGHPNPHAEWRRGGRVPAEYRGHQYVVNDWRGHHLQQPQRGYQWVGVGGDFVLAAVATGLIAQIIVGQ
ncbi:RcnB family protein [Variovorax saccharolyticus]|uniref:RcnB family protein n=1 Tax=Variovorax saccharolyticus TaxID=3053516 RepID=UPI0025757528|nr:RcnB family protein [Variovorax sp. J22R187]MDM0021597.1 RcnB family protein [Variovorax sp. J22R187]